MTLHNAADYKQLQQALFLKVTEVPCEPPSPRASATLIGSPSNHKELFLFGGEYFNGALATFYNDLLVYHVEKDEWRRVTSPNSPLPRSGHAWCRGGNAGGIYLFGGTLIVLFDHQSPFLLSNTYDCTNQESSHPRSKEHFIITMIFGGWIPPLENGPE